MGGFLTFDWNCITSETKFIIKEVWCYGFSFWLKMSYDGVKQENKKSFGLGVLKENNFKSGLRKGSSFWSQNSRRGYQKMVASSNSKPLCRECNKDHLGQCLKGGDICFWCKKSGHFAKNRPLVSSSQPRDQGTIYY